jgi:hypothetical protein
MYAYIDRKKLPVTTLFYWFERDKDILEIFDLKKLKFLKQDLKNISVEN